VAIHALLQTTQQGGSPKAHGERGGGGGHSPETLSSLSSALRAALQMSQNLEELQAEQKQMKSQGKPGWAEAGSSPSQEPHGHRGLEGQDQGLTMRTEAAFSEDFPPYLPFFLF